MQVDLDTIETSNLNRQFLFRKHHVGQSKAQVAAEVIRSIKPEATIIAHHANIKVRGMASLCTIDTLVSSCQAGWVGAQQ